MLSVLIAARNEIYLEKTIRDILSNAEGEIEIIVELDGYIPNPQIVLNDNRVQFIHNPVSIGQRQCINHAAKLAKGKYIMKVDAHVAFDKGFDVKLIADATDPSVTWIPRMYNLDVELWKPKLHKLTDYMYISSPTTEKPFRAEYYTGSEYRKVHSNPKLIDDTMACMGPCWFMHKDRFFEQGGCDEGHGGWGAMSVEVSMKAWLSGGSLKVNKKTWFAHYFRGGVGFPYQISGKDVDKARKYSQDLWLNDKWDKATRKLQWVIDKFQPIWEQPMPDNTPDIFNKKEYYRHTIHSGRINDAAGTHKVRWMGTPVIKYPSDMMIYQEILYKNKPDILIETGTDWGGSALFFAHMFDIIGKGQVITIDKFPKENRPIHPRITYLTGGSTSTEVMLKVLEMTKGKTVMVSLDSSHTRRHVKRELVRYAPIVSKGQYLVVEDTNYSELGVKNGPDEAVEWFLGRTKEFEVVPLENKWIYSCNPRGFLRKR